MISYLMLYDSVPEAFFLHHALLLSSFSKLRIGKESYGAMLGEQPALADAQCIAMPGHAPNDAAQMLEQGKQVLRDRHVAVKEDDRLLVFNMRYYPLDREWFSHVLDKHALTDIPLVVMYSGRAALAGMRCADNPEEMTGPETAVIENTHDRFVDIGHTDNVLRLVSSNFSLRWFNSLRAGRTGYFQKCSADVRKMRAEHAFLSALPVQVRPFFPVVGDFSEEDGKGGYEIESVPAFDVAKLLINGRFAAPESMDGFMQALEAYLDACPRQPCAAQEYTLRMRALFVAKTEERMDALARLPAGARLDLICRLHGFESLAHFTAAHLALVEKSIAADSGNELVFSHGDLCFSNILFDPITGKMKLIDPKGGADVFLPAWYDIAKLSHSFLGRYDMLVYGEFSVSTAEDISPQLHTVDMPGAGGLEERFLGLLRGRGLDLGTTRLFEAALFLSMLPLHAESPLRMCGQLLRALDIHKRLTVAGAPLRGAWTWRGDGS